MRSAELHPCAEPGCRRRTLWFRCVRHETGADVLARVRATHLATEHALARDAWVSAHYGADPVTITETGRIMANLHGLMLDAEERAGLVL